MLDEKSTNALLPDSFLAYGLTKQENAIVWEKCPNSIP